MSALVRLGPNAYVTRVPIQLPAGARGNARPFGSILFSVLDLVFRAIQV